MKTKDLVQHTETNNSTYGFNLLNDRQRSLICGEFDFLHCAINDDVNGGKALLRDGKTIEFKLTLAGIKY